MTSCMPIIAFKSSLFDFAEYDSYSLVLLPAFASFVDVDLECCDAVLAHCSGTEREAARAERV